MEENTVLKTKDFNPGAWTVSLVPYPSETNQCQIYAPAIPITS